MSVGNLLTATTAFSPKCLMIPMCRARLAAPPSISAIPPLMFPPWCLRARTVATSTVALDRSPPIRQVMSKNFSIPMSDANPDSVIRYSPSLSPTRSATSELFPCAMFAKGPQWMNAGCPSSVWTRFGLIASLRTTAIDPAAFSCSAVTGSPSKVWPTVIRPRRARRSPRSRATATSAMISLAAVMSKPVCRG